MIWKPRRINYLKTNTWICIPYSDKKGKPQTRWVYGSKSVTSSQFNRYQSSRFLITVSKSKSKYLSNSIRKERNNPLNEFEAFRSSLQCSQLAKCVTVVGWALQATVNDCAAHDTRLTGLCEHACGNIKENT